MVVSTSSYYLTLPEMSQDDFTALTLLLNIPVSSRVLSLGVNSRRVFHLDFTHSTNKPQSAYTHDLAPQDPKLIGSLINILKLITDTENHVHIGDYKTYNADTGVFL
jgi:hypothetical protein